MKINIEIGTESDGRTVLYSVDWTVDGKECGLECLSKEEVETLTIKELIDLADEINA